MIAWIDGKVKTRDPQSGEVILDVGGVGYSVLVSLQCMAQVPEIGQSCELWVHTEMREHQIALFGFATQEAKRLFNLLTTVPKVGPKLALATLGGFSLETLLGAIASGDAKTLQKISGIGKRSAEQIVLTLQERVSKFFDPLSAHAPGESVVATPGANVISEAQAMLVALGWKPKAVDQILAALTEDKRESWPLDELVRRALARLMEG